MGNDLNAWISNFGIVDGGFDLLLNPWKNENAEKKSKLVCSHASFLSKKKKSFNVMPGFRYKMKTLYILFLSHVSSIIRTEMKHKMKLKLHNVVIIMHFRHGGVTTTTLIR